MNALPRSFRSAAGFTLVELLTVIAIIAVLCSLLAPGLARSKQKANQIFCLNNARQQMIGILLYSEDHNDFLPPVTLVDSDDEEVSWTKLLAPYFPGRTRFLCPGDKQSKEISYGLNEIAFVDQEDDSDATPVKTSAFPNFASTVALGDLGTADDFLKGIPDARKMVPPSAELDDKEDGRPSVRHNLRTNIGFMDGHCEVLRLRDFYLEQSPPDRWFTGR